MLHYIHNPQRQQTQNDMHFISQHCLSNWLLAGCTLLTISVNFAFLSNLNLLRWHQFNSLHGKQPRGYSLWTWWPRDCVNHGNKLHTLILFYQQGGHFVRQKSSIRISTQKVWSMALLLHNQLHIMCGKLSNTSPVFTDDCGVGKAQSIKGYQILITKNKKYGQTLRDFCKW